ncbi:MAG: rubredoxin [Bacillota bacterium]|nr:rubredoxin [Bacillota bacterium]
MWRCSVCNFLAEGVEAPEQCPKCGAPKEKFGQLSEDEATLVERSLYSNDLLMELSTLLNEVAIIAEEGIDDELDPGCVKIFQTALENADFLQRSIKAEIINHIGKKKWG